MATIQSVQARVFDIQRMCIHDGPGIRTTVFLKGCPLRCVWCHNPEGISRRTMISFVPAKCIACGACGPACEAHCHVISNGRHVFDRAACAACGACVEACPTGALEKVGRDMSVREVLCEVLRDKPYYDASGGGVTLSGGEPMVQPEFTENFLRGAKDAGLHTAVETCGFGPAHLYRRVLPFVDLFLYDIKETDPSRHREYTGVELQPILDNLTMLTGLGARVLLRLPVIPGLNDRDEHLIAVARLAANLPRYEGIEIMPYHALGTSKLDRFGLDRAHAAIVEPPTSEVVARWARIIRNEGAKVINEVG